MKTTTRVAAIAATTLLGVTGLAACGSSSNSASSGSASASSSPSAKPSMSMSAGSSMSSSSKPSSGSATKKSAMIMIKDYKFSGATSVAPGTKITITNADAEAHTVTADSGGAFDVKVDPGKSVTLTAPSKAGTYAYHCSYHSQMHGSLKVS